MARLLRTAIVPRAVLTEGYRVLRGLKERHPQLPPHYIYAACQGISNGIRSFPKLKRRGLARSDKPGVNRVAVSLDTRLWSSLGYTAVRLFLYVGWFFVEYKPHRRYWRYIDDGWGLRTQQKIKLDNGGRLYKYTKFGEDVKVREGSCGEIVPVDVGRGNIVVKVGDKVCILETGVKKLALGYAGFRESVQSFKGEGYVERAIRYREQRGNGDRRCKIANTVVNTAKQLSAVVVVENLPRNVSKNMIRGIRDKKLRHRICQAGLRSLIKVVEGMYLEKGVPIAKVNSRVFSSERPFCSSQLVRRPVLRQLRCARCGIEVGGDVVMTVNHYKRYLAPEGGVSSTIILCEPGLEVAVLPVKEWVRRKSLEPGERANHSLGATGLC